MLTRLLDIYLLPLPRFSFNLWKFFVSTLEYFLIIRYTFDGALYTIYRWSPVYVNKLLICIPITYTYTNTITKYNLVRVRGSKISSMEYRKIPIREKSTHSNWNFAFFEKWSVRVKVNVKLNKKTWKKFQS